MEMLVILGIQVDLNSIVSMKIQLFFSIKCFNLLNKRNFELLYDIFFNIKTSFKYFYSKQSLGYKKVDE